MNIPLLALAVLAALLVGRGARPDYAATPFFSETGFRKVRVGMSEGEVRALLGYPASRFGPIDAPTANKVPKMT